MGDFTKNPEGRALFCMFNKRFFKYARIMITTFQYYHSDIPVYCFCVNSKVEMKEWVSSRYNVVPIYITKKFKSPEKRRVYFVASCFVLYYRYASKHRHIKKIIGIDVEGWLKRDVNHIYEYLDNL